MRILPTIWVHICKVLRVAVHSSTVRDGHSWVRAGSFISFPPQFAESAIDSQPYSHSLANLPRDHRASEPGPLGAYRGRVGHVGHQGVRRNLTEPPSLEVLEGLSQ